MWGNIKQTAGQGKQMAISIIHTADWQIGKPFANIPGDAGAMLREQRFHTIRRIAEVAQERAVDAVLVAGDVFDNNAVKDETIRRAMNAMAGFPGPWVLLPGNHDAALAESVWTRIKRWGVPDNLMLATSPEPIALADGRAVVLPAPLRRRQEVVDLTEWFDAAETPAGAVRIGLAHGSVANRLPEEAEAKNPIADDRADRARLDYLALGDWHGTREIAPRTWYAGTPEPDRWKENDPGNALLVKIEGPGAQPSVERIPVGHFHWRRLEASIHSRADIESLDADLRHCGIFAERLVVALRLAGAVDLATRKTLDDLFEQWRAQLRCLEVSDAGLISEPSEDDLDRIDRGGFVRTAVDRLRARADDPSDGNRDAARRALQILYVEHVRTGA
jgi:DNA repair exonuclease SbcCD nuclease subunit